MESRLLGSHRSQWLELKTRLDSKTRPTPDTPGPGHFKPSRLGQDGFFILKPSGHTNEAQAATAVQRMGQGAARQGPLHHPSVTNRALISPFNDTQGP